MRNRKCQFELFRAWLHKTSEEYGFVLVYMYDRLCGWENIGRERYHNVGFVIYLFALDFIR